MDELTVVDRAAYLAVMDEILTGISAVLDDLDDETVNHSPRPGRVNTAYALVAHVHGMAWHWGGSVIAGERWERDRDAEFRARGTVDEARRLLVDLRERLPGWVDIAAAEGVRNRRATGSTRTDAATASAAWILQHILRECAQHLGHLQITRDLVEGGGVGARRGGEG